ncbi:MAG TPA: rhodanese-like domain-containing protein [Accumulibacter sp.]|nr:rhodanese-like domain-containing protein [Accumulibacter sp.]HMY07039.1 rhodanese-like domain-containing protein [Accumulibacter sp.]HNG39817.1 rhodanese-like domain-containing protein [Accumulibacter sp.]HNI72346.1 rhodanese-like domain-containing protein [Accumulibacter sp.]HNK01626.1 rhodanese-like domain-containing protein [Accumulibacter sp.]
MSSSAVGLVPNDLSVEATDDRKLDSRFSVFPTEIVRRTAPAGLPFAGSLTSVEAWALSSRGLATLVDVRTAEELKFVGHVPGSRHVAWMTGLSLVRNPRFVRDLEAIADKSEPLLLLCRSGKRSAAAAEAATKAGFRYVFNIEDGFEGNLDAEQRRGRLNGWRHAGLPWIQD